MCSMHDRVTYIDAPEGASMRASTSRGSGSTAADDLRSTEYDSARNLFQRRPRECTMLGSAVGTSRLPIMPLSHCQAYLASSSKASGAGVVSGLRTQTASQSDRSI